MCACRAISNSHVWKCNWLLLALKFTISFAASTTSCGKYDSVVSANGRYQFNTDSWGNDGSGFGCITFDPSTITADNSTQLEAIWMWENNAQNVHGYANVELQSVLFPIPVSSIGALDLDVSWSMRAFGQPKTSDVNVTALNAVQARTDVVLDSFLDYSPNNAANASVAKVEIMIFLAAYGMLPAGYGTSITSLPSITVAGNTFTLITGTGPSGQTVYSWYPSQNITTANFNVLPMFQYFWQNGYFYDSMYLGLVQFGTETEHCGWWSNITFSADRIYLNLQNTAGVALSQSAAIISTVIPSASSKSLASTSSKITTSATSSVSSTISQAVISSQHTVQMSSTMISSGTSSSYTSANPTAVAAAQTRSIASIAVGASTLRQFLRITAICCTVWLTWY